MSFNASGTFRELVVATQSISLLRSNSSAINCRIAAPSVPAQTEFILGDILARIPALQDNYVRWRGEAKCLPLKHAKDTAGIKIELPRAGRHWLTQARAAEFFAGTAYSPSEETEKTFVFVGPDDVSQLPGITDHPGAFSIPDLWLTALYPGSHKLSKMATSFLLTYALGMLVRYHPTMDRASEGPNKGCRLADYWSSDRPVGETVSEACHGVLSRRSYLVERI